MTTRVAIIGASGIGRHHARWWQVEGATVYSFAGSSESTIANTAAALETHLGKKVPGYVDIKKMLDETKPDIVDICSPPQYHAAHTQLALEAGCDVLCEKPFLYLPDTSAEALLETAHRLIAQAENASKRLCVCTQYTVGVEKLHEVYMQASSENTISRFHGQLEAPAKGRAADPIRIWVDLAPHLLSVVLALYPEMGLNQSSLKIQFDGYRAKVAFQATTHTGTIECLLETANRTEPPNNIRRFVFNETAIDVDGQKGQDGEFEVVLRTSKNSVVCDDMMRLLIRRFLAGELPVPTTESIRNLELMLYILETAKKQSNLL